MEVTFLFIKRNQFYDTSSVIKKPIPLSIK